MATTSSPNMLLPVPTVGVEAGPTWATDINNCLSIIDSHNHTPGYGVQITPDGLNINSDLTLGNNNLTNARSLRLTVQTTPLALPTDLACLYASGVDLYFNDNNGNQIRITQSGGVAGSPGSISNLTSPASASYVSGTQTFVWQSAASTPANLDAGYIILRNNTASSRGLTLYPPTAMGSNFSIILPSLPVQTNIMTLDASGNMAASFYPDNSTLEVSGSSLRVKASGITATQIASDAVTTAKILNSNVTTAKIADSNVTTAKIADLNVTAAKIANSTITATQLASNAVTTVKITDSNVTTAKIADSNVTTAKIADLNVTTAKIANNAVTQAKRAALGNQSSVSSGSFTTSSASLVNVTGVTTNIACTGRPMYVQLMSDGSGTAAYIASSSASIITLAILRNGVIAASYDFFSGAGGISRWPSCISFIDLDLTVNSRDYTLQMSSSAGTTATCFNTMIIAYEL